MAGNTGFHESLNMSETVCHLVYYPDQDFGAEDGHSTYRIDKEQEPSSSPCRSHEVRELWRLRSENRLFNQAEGVVSMELQSHYLQNIYI